VGTIRDVHSNNGWTKLNFSVQREIELPSDALSNEVLIDLIGKKIGILNCDGAYKIRKVGEK